MSVGEFRPSILSGVICHLSPRKKYVEIMNGVKIAREMQASTVNSKGEKRSSEAGKKASKVGSKGAKAKKRKKTKAKSKGKQREEPSESEECSDAEASTSVSNSSSTSTSSRRASVSMSCSPPPPPPPIVVATLPAPKISKVSQDNHVNIAVYAGPVHSHTTAPKNPTSPRILESTELKTPEGQRTQHVQISQTVKKSFTPANSSSPGAATFGGAGNSKNQTPLVRASTQVSNQGPPYKSLNNIPLVMRDHNDIPLQVQQKQGPYPWSRSYNNWNMDQSRVFHSQR